MTEHSHRSMEAASAAVSESVSRIVLAESPDIVATIGREGLLEERVGADAVVWERARRIDVLAQRVIGASPEDLDPPESLVSWVRTASSTSVDREDVSLVVLSLFSDIVGPPPWRHRSTGWLAHPDPDYADRWPRDAIDWFEARFEKAAPLTADGWFDALQTITSALGQADRALVLFGVSTFDPDERTHNFAGIDNTYAMTASRLIAMLESNASTLGVEVIDVDGAIAELGAAQHVPAPGLFSEAAAEFITEDVIQAIDRSGALTMSMQASAMRLTVPSFDRRTTSGKLLRWRAAPNTQIEEGAPLVDIGFEVQKFRSDREAGSKRHGSWRSEGRRLNRITVSVVAGANGWLSDLLVEEGSDVETDDAVAIVTTGEEIVPPEIADVEATFRVGVRLVEE